MGIYELVVNQGLGPSTGLHRSRTSLHKRASKLNFKDIECYRLLHGPHSRIEVCAPLNLWFSSESLPGPQAPPKWRFKHAGESSSEPAGPQSPLPGYQMTSSTLSPERTRKACAGTTSSWGENELMKYLDRLDLGKAGCLDR
ncbi:unnamed protein product [Phytophthora fragariaefolia]|uniref:Unnamed protein product n=1 Tax=Phytophthora fragariaefolia TaxID=1490495 RepID=A0A9W6YD29_9STRA|nr:unnamed protein product [Phytophthora fragariaefolia]